MTTLDRATVDHLLTTTRAVRKRLDLNRAVEPEVIEECLRLAIQAPTGGNSQGWRWIVVTDADKRARARGGVPGDVAPVPRGQPGSGARSGRAAGAGPWTRRATSPTISTRCRSTSSRASTAATWAVPSSSSRPASSARSIPAVWSFQLALRSRGLGSAFTTLHLPKRARGGGAARHPGRRGADRADPGRLLHRRRLQARGAAAGREDHVLERLEAAAGLTDRKSARITPRGCCSTRRCRSGPWCLPTVPRTSHPSRRGPG